MKTKKMFVMLSVFIGVFSMVVCVVNFDGKEMSLSAKNIEAFAGIIDPSINITPSPQGYCRCKDKGCYAGNMISFRANCGHNITLTKDKNTETYTFSCSSADACKP